MSKTKFIVEPNSQVIVMSRLFNAPAERIFKAYMDPELLPQWWGPRQYKTVVDKMEVRPGGMWRYVQHDAEGNEFAFHGVYHLVDAPRQIVDTFEYEGLPERHVAMETVTLEEHAGQTTLTATTVFQSMADRDAMVASGMEGGAAESMDRLGELVEGR